MFVKYRRLSIDWPYCSILDTHTCFQKIYSLVILCQNTCEYENKTYIIEILIKYNKLRNTIFFLQLIIVIASDLRKVMAIGYLIFIVLRLMSKHVVKRRKHATIHKNKLHKKCAYI